MQYNFKKNNICFLLLFGLNWLTAQNPYKIELGVGLGGNSGIFQSPFYSCKEKQASLILLEK